MKIIEPTDLLHIAQQAVMLAAAHANKNLHRREESISTDAHDIKLALDVECQALIETCIHESFPEHAILGEEGATPKPDMPYEWIIDPIDGTVNFSHGFPYWCSSVAVQYNGETVAGAVYAPETDELFSAAIGEPAYHNETPIQPTRIPHIPNAMVLTGMNKQRIYIDQPTFSTFSQLATQAQKIRISGAAALDLCQVAAGRCDAFVEYGLYVWDFAAAGFIAQQAGATFTVQPDPAVPHRAAVLCANPILHAELEPLWKEGMPHA
jgi:myo-inositol-1(or 4)-monophosphatase